MDPHVLRRVGPLGNATSTVFKFVRVESREAGEDTLDVDSLSWDLKPDHDVILTSRETLQLLLISRHVKSHQERNRPSLNNSQRLSRSSHYGCTQ
jgi:hypothetical protein